MQHPPYPSEPPGRPAPPQRARMPGALVFVLVTVAVSALGTAYGSWTLLQENHSKQEHGQELLVPMGMAWFVALFCWGLAALEITCVVLARKRRPWVGAVLAGCLIFVVLATVVGFLGSLVAGAPNLAVLLVLGIDLVAVWVALGETARRWFSVRPPLPTAQPPG
ncbi:hypothetical protein JW613_00565 [Streptomyces smyrnaeus]|uniref:DUF2637 domain-containing protein n=1 Tax=Streptomyces smyrnaeus TaxID=1387713 RepID=A0ABS3XN43_9ACTN|nr:hypothetical protein [Streptomyces smyrnaeus]MBO8196811.1 hypothetical protein [Streptomyces smyrnaeus]